MSCRGGFRFAAGISGKVCAEEEVWGYGVWLHQDEGLGELRRTQEHRGWSSSDSNLQASSGRHIPAPSAFPMGGTATKAPTTTSSTSGRRTGPCSLAFAISTTTDSRRSSNCSGSPADSTVTNTTTPDHGVHSAATDHNAQGREQPAKGSEADTCSRYP